MKSLKAIFLAAAAAGLMAACAPPNPPATNTTNTANANTNANANMAAKPAAPSKEALSSLEKQAFEAWKNKDGKFFDGFLASNFMMAEGGRHYDKAATVKMINENPCQVKSYSMSDEQVMSVSPDVAVITMKVTADVTCDGKPQPSPVTSASVYVKQGNDWKGAYHAEVPIVDAKAATDKKAAAAPPPPPPAANTSTAPAAGNAELTAKLMDYEKQGWEAWKNHDNAKLDSLLASTVSAVRNDGMVLATKADVLKDWAAPCTVNSVNVSDGHAVEIAPNVAMLMYKGTATGKCGDMDLKPEYGTTVSIKEGDAWKAAFFVFSPA